MDMNPTAYKLDSEQGEALWFFGGLVTVKASAEQSGTGVTLTNSCSPEGWLRRFTANRTTTSRSTSSKEKSHSTLRTANPYRRRLARSSTYPQESRTPSR